MPRILMGTCRDRGSTSPTVVYASSTRSHTSTPPPWARPSGCAFPRLKPAASASEATANIIVGFPSLLPAPPLTSPLDCGIRPATSTEAEWLQDYIRRSNNHAGLPAATLPVPPSHGAQINIGFTREGSRSDPDDEDDDGSEGASSNGNAKCGPGPKHNSLLVKSPTLYAMDISDKTPTNNSLQQQVAARPTPDTAFSQTPAQIRRRSQGPPPNPNQQNSFPLPGSGPAAQPPPTVGGTQGSAPVPFISNPHQSISVRVLPNFPNIEDALGANSSSPHGLAAREVWRWFEDHLDALLESVRSFRFDQFEIHLRTFWASLSGDHREVVHAPAVAGLMARADAIVYDVRTRTSHAYPGSSFPCRKFWKLCVPRFWRPFPRTR